MRNVIKVSGLMCIVAASMALGAAEPVLLSGIVSGPDGQTIEDAAVNAYRVGFTTETGGGFDISHEAATTSDVNGRFSLSLTHSALPGHQATMLFAEKEGYSIAFAYIMGHEDIQLQMTEPQTLSGRVQDARGDAVADALVQLPMLSVPIGQITGDVRQIPMAIGFEPIPYFTTRTDDEGRFTFTNLPENCTAEIMVKKPGLAPFQSARGMGSPQHGCTYTVGKDDIVLTLPDPLTLTGVVTDPDGQAVSDVTVMLRESDTFYSFTYAPVQTDADGAFIFTDVAPGSVALSISDPAWMSEIVTVDVQADMAVPLTVSTGTLLTVTVVDGMTEEPIQGAHVQINVEQQRAMPQMGQTQEDGTFQKRLTPGTYHIHTHAAGYSRGHHEIVEITDDQPVKLTLSLGPTAKITGTVTDSDGKPVAGAEVFTLPRHHTQQTLPITDEQGVFVLAWEPEHQRWTDGEFYILASHRDENLAVAERIDEDTTDIHLTLQPGLTVSGKVTDPDGAPIAEAAVQVMFRGSRWSTSMTRGPQHTTDTDGRYTISALPPDQRYNLHIIGPTGYGTGSIDIEEQLEERRQITASEITLKHANLSVSGTIVDEDGSPVQGVRLHMHGTGQPSGNAVSDSEGKFAFDAVCEGTLRITAWHHTANEQLHANVQTEGGAQDITIILAPPEQLGGFIPRRPGSLVGEPLPDLSGYGIELAEESSPVLVCVWDWRQRPSRHLVQQLADRAEALARRSVQVVLLNAEPTDRDPLEAWLSNADIPLACGIIETDPKEAHFTLGVQAMPWLILTDTEQKVVAEGFALSELTDKLDEMTGSSD